MRFSSALFALATVGLTAASPIESRQEAARFGIVSVSPTKIKLDDTLTIKYNSTLARFKPQYLDFYIQGIRQDNGYVDPYYLLHRSKYPAHAHTFTFQTRIPAMYASPTNGYDNETAYSIWAFITYPTLDTGALTIGGVQHRTVVMFYDFVLI